MRYAYFRLPKTASRSVCHAIKKINYRDTIQKLGHNDKKVSRRKATRILNRDPKIKMLSAGVELIWSELEERKYENWNHWLKSRENKEFWKNTIKFSTIRNPWDRAISSWKFCFGDLTLKEFCLNLLEKKLKIGSEDWWHTVPMYDNLIDEEGKLIVDHLIRFENLQNDFDDLCKKYRWGKTILPHVNKTSRSHYLNYYDKETKGIIGQVYKKDIEYFGYFFGGLRGLS